MNFIVITSIFPPTAAVRTFAGLDDWQLVVVGDKKTPADWKWPGVDYLSPTQQTASAFRTAAVLPWNHYCRKMLGYLHAVSRGATAIADTDDDNAPYDDWAFPADRGAFPCVAAPPFHNVYRNFTSQPVWPRGFPLRYITSALQESERVEEARIGVWQGLADGDPDVDAIYRLTVGNHIDFDRRDPVVLAPGTVCPFNSQNTLFFEQVFPLLYLPATVTFRFTDILRSLVAQPILWTAGLRLGFTSATVRQDRNDHDYLDDFESEVPMYLRGEEVTELAQDAVAADETVGGNLRRVYEALADVGVVLENELDVLDAWLGDLAALSQPS